MALWCLSTEVRVHKGTVRVLVTAVLAAVLDVVPLNSADITPQRSNLNAMIWRDAQHGGLNCLLLLCNIHEHMIKYEDCLKSIDKNSLPESAADILQFAKRIGFTLEARSVSPSELNSVRLPVIIHMDGDSPASGYFSVLVGRSPSRVSVFVGPTAVVISMDKELFLRRWSGVIMYPKRNIFLATPTFAAFIIAMVITSLIRRRSIPVRM